MAFTAPQLKAIGWYAEANNLKMTLSTNPTVYFYKQDGTKVVVGMQTISDQYAEHKKEASKQRARERSAEKKKKEQDV